ncbi:MAG TPA: VWA domain-containing protein [Bryobacteraceae bacterium]|jgi:VWFA-related protein
MLLRTSCATLLLWSAAFAQDDSVVRLKVETRVVQVAVAVKDVHGRPVRDLRKEDFTVLDEGRRRDIALFSTEAETAEAPVRPPSLPPNVYSNRFGANASRGRVTAILIDGVNTGWSLQSYARGRAIEAVDRMAPGESIALYTMTPNLAILQDYTTDRALLRKALESYWPAVPTQTDRVPNRPGVMIPQLPRNPVANADMRRRVEDTLSYLRLIASHMAAAGGRKSIVWLTGGFPNFAEYSELFNSTMRAINDANVAIYPVDARGLLASSGAAINIRLMQRFAEQTGGQAYYNRNDVGEAIVEAVADSRYNYSLGFYLSDKDLDGRFHVLKVKVNRSGLVLHARNGYTAVSDPLETGRKKPRESPAAVLLTPIDSTGIGIDATADKLENGMLRVRVAIYPGAPGEYTWSLVLLQTDARGLPVERTEVGLRLTLKYRQSANWEKAIPLRKDATKLRLFLREIDTGRSGSLTVPL